MDEAGGFWTEKDITQLVFAATSTTPRMMYRLLVLSQTQESVPCGSVSYTHPEISLQYFENSELVVVNVPVELNITQNSPPAVILYRYVLNYTLYVAQELGI